MMNWLLGLIGLYTVDALSKAESRGRFAARSECDAAVSSAKQEAMEWRGRAEKAEAKVREQLTSDAAVAALRVLKAILENAPPSQVAAYQAQMLAAQQSLNAYRPGQMYPGSLNVLGSMFGAGFAR